jgi:nucleotide-binding universal stress UspA family protein
MIKKILFPTDGSEAAQNALEYVLKTADLTDSNILVLNVVEKMIKSLNFGLESQLDDTLKEASERLISKTLEQIIKRGIKAESKIEFGTPHVKILEIAQKEDVDLIIMATQGLSGLARLMLGSVADRVIRGAGCPVLLIPYSAELKKD